LVLKAFCINVEYANRKASSLSAFCLPSCCCRYPRSSASTASRKAGSEA